MSQTNYLNFYKLSLRRYGQGEYCSFEELYNYFDVDLNGDEDAIFNRIVIEYVKSFNSGFAMSNDSKRAMTARTEFIKHDKNDKIIYGFVEGGITNTEFEKYNRKSNVKADSSVTTGDVLSQHYFFLLWLPSDTNIGIAILQSNDSVDKGIASVFFDHLKDFFKSRNFTIDKQSYTPKKVIESYKKNADVTAIDVIQTIDVDPFKSKHGIVNQIKVKHTISGFRIESKEILKNLKDRNLLKKLIAEAGLSDISSSKVQIKLKEGSKTERTYTLEGDMASVRVVIDNDVDMSKSDYGIKSVKNFVNQYFKAAREEITKTRRS